MGNITCDGSSKQNELNQPLSIQKISKRLQEYAITNNIMFQSLQTRQAIEKLLVIGQTHVCDKLLELSRQKKQDQKKELISDIKRIDLQQFDQLIYMTKLLKQNHLKLKLIYNTSNKNQQSAILKINAKYLQQGQNTLRKNKLLFIINCSNLQDITSPSNLITKKSPLQLFNDKIQALQLRYKCRHDVVIICAKRKLQQLSILLPDSFKIVPYQPSQPCFSSKGKIALYGNRLQFNESQGDLILFIMRNNFFKQITKNYDFVNFCDVSNFATPAINPIHLGWLATHHNVKMLASLKLNDRDTRELQVKNSFIQSKQNFGDIIVKTEVFELINKKQNMVYQALASRIVRKQKKDYTDCYYFSRRPADILYKSFTQVTRVSFVANNCIEYSNFCKGALGLENQDQNDLVQVCPSILHGEPSRLQQIKLKLQKQASKYSYPIIIMKVNEIEQ